MPEIPSGFLVPPSELSELSELLEGHGIDTSKYGKDAAKPLAKLLKECATKRCSFQLDPASGKLQRVVRVCECRFYRTQGGSQRILIEAREQSTDGWEKQKNRLPAKKMFPEDSARDAAENICKQELRVDNFCGMEVVEHKDPIQRVWESESYPGLESVYITLTATVLLGGLPQQNHFTTAHIEDPKLSHVWEWIDLQQYSSSLDEKKRFWHRQGKLASKDSLEELVRTLEEVLHRGERRFVVQKLLQRLHRSVENEDHTQVLLDAGVLTMLTRMLDSHEKASAVHSLDLMAHPESPSRNRMPLLNGSIWQDVPNRLQTNNMFKRLVALALWSLDLRKRKSIRRTTRHCLTMLCLLPCLLHSRAAAGGPARAVGSGGGEASYHGAPSPPGVSRGQPWHAHQLRASIACVLIVSIACVLIVSIACVLIASIARTTNA
jgi:hypothetical protein